MDRILDGLRAAAELTRLRILALCTRADLTVSDLVRILGQSQPRISHHLKQLAEAGLLVRYREGQWIYHRVATGGAGGRVASAVVGLIASETPHFSADLARLEEVSQDRHAAAEAYFSANAENWDRIRSLHVDEAKVERAIAEMTADLDARNLLDIGTGTGRMLQLLSGRLDEAVGVDINRDMLRIARVNLERGGVRNCHVRLADMYRLPWADGSFDCAVLHQVLHYAEHPAAVIGEAARVLRPDGRLLIVDFAPHKLDELRSSHAHRWLGFEDDDVSSWCKAGGLDIERTRRLRGRPLVVSIWRARRLAPDMPVEGRRAA
ncbi:MAG: ArsR/SmtB family transcription factor [Alphaproteobacteria bacterium]